MSTPISVRAPEPGRAQAAEHERHRQQRREQDGHGARDARPEREFLVGRCRDRSACRCRIRFHNTRVSSWRGDATVSAEEIAADRRTRTRGCPGAADSMRSPPNACWRNARASSCRRLHAWRWSRWPRSRAGDPASARRCACRRTRRVPTAGMTLISRLPSRTQATAAAREADVGKLGEQPSAAWPWPAAAARGIRRTAPRGTPAAGRPWRPSRRCATPRCPRRASP